MNDIQEQGLSVSRPESFQLKGALIPMSVLELRLADIDKVKSELQKKVAASPEFFKNNPVVLSFEHLESAIGFDLKSFCQFCLGLGLLPTGVKGVDDSLKLTAQSLGLAVFPKGKLAKEKLPLSGTSFSNSKTEEPAREKVVHSKSESYGARARRITAAKLAMPGDSDPENLPGQDDILTQNVQEDRSAVPEQAEPALGETKVIKTPVRSGQQIYSTGDMVILAPVSAGAEVLAAGSIHIYGPLRGRALAGVRGNTNARVFCQSQEAELISIAGQFMIDENLRSANWREPAQAYIENDELIVEKLDF